MESSAARVARRDKLLVGPSAKPAPDQAGGQRVEGAVDLGVVIASDLGLSPQRHIIGCGGWWAQHGFLLGLEVLERPAPGGGMRSDAIIIETPVMGMVASGLEVVETFAGEAVLASRGNGALDACFVASPSNPRGVDVKASGLGVLEEGGIDEGVEGVGLLHNGGGVIRQQHFEDPAVECPSDFARLDGHLSGFAKAGIDEAVAREDGGEDPGAEAAPTPALIGLEQSHPTGVELEFLAGLPVGHGDGGGVTPEAELGDGKAVQRRVRDVYALATQ